MERRKVNGGPVHRVRVGSVVVPIYRVETRTGVVFTLAWRVGGVRKRRSKASFAAAKEEAIIIAESLARGGESTGTLSGEELMSFRRCRALLEPTGVHIETAVLEWAEARQILGDVSVLEAARIAARQATARLQDAGKTVAEAVAAYLETKRAAGRSAVHLKDLQLRLNRFAGRFVGPVRELHWPDVADWVRRLAADVGGPLTGRSRNNYLATVAAFFRWCIRQRWLAETAAPDLSERYAVDPGEIAIYTPEEFARLLEAAEGPLRAVIALGGWAGIRTAEIERMSWGQVRLEADTHFPHGWIELIASQAKNRRKHGARARRLVPMCAALRAVLEPLQGAADARIWTKSDLPDFFPPLAQRAGVPWKRNGLRHSFGSYRYAATLDVAKVAAEMGNSPDEVFASYRQVVTPAAAERWFSGR